MEIQKCPMCEKDFMPPNDGRSHQFCSAYCMRKYGKRSRAVDMQYRKEMGLPRRRTMSKNVTRGYFIKGENSDL